MNEVLIAVAVCCAVAAGLTILILIVNGTVGNYGECELDINEGAKVLKVDGGETLLSSLNSQSIFIPSACGGKGSCGLCKLKVLDGAGDVLPTEAPWLTAEEVKEKIRLSCQIKVKSNLKLEIPEEYFNVKEFDTKVTSIVDLTHDIKQVTLSLREPSEINFKAGQFMQIKVPKYEHSNEEVYRAYSLSSSNLDIHNLEFEIRLVPNGICTTYVHDYLKEGDNLTVNGPYGDFYLRDTDADIIFIAGGSGMAPIKSILHNMEENKIARKSRYFFGARSLRDLFLVDRMKEFEKNVPDFTFIPALSSPLTEDKWEGESGIITEVLNKHVSSVDNTEAYLCGSPGMINACIEVLTKKGLPEDKIYYDNFG